MDILLKNCVLATKNEIKLHRNNIFIFLLLAQTLFSFDLFTYVQHVTIRGFVSLDVRWHTSMYVDLLASHSQCFVKNYQKNRGYKINLSA